MSHVNVTWMKRGFNACQTHRSMYPAIFNRFPVIQPVNCIRLSDRMVWVIAPLEWTFSFYITSVFMSLFAVCYSVSGLRCVNYNDRLTAHSTSGNCHVHSAKWTCCECSCILSEAFSPSFPPKLFVNECSHLCERKVLSKASSKNFSLRDNQ